MGKLGAPLAALCIAVCFAILGGQMGRILFLLFLSATIAYLGDELGSRFGKKRLSILGLRPKYTSMVLNVAAGMAITMVTLLSASLTSDTFRAALFDVEKLQAQQRDLTKSVEERRQERDKLSAEAAELTSKVVALENERGDLTTKNEHLNKVVDMKEGTFIVFPIGKPLLPQPFLFPIDISKEQFEQVMLRMVEEIGRLAKLRRVVLTAEQKELAHLKEVVPNIYQDIQKMRERFKKRKEAGQLEVVPTECFVEARSDKNVGIGEELHNINFAVGANLRVFGKGERVASITVDGERPRSEILEQLFLFDQRVMYDMQQRGVSPYSLEARGRQFTAPLLLEFVRLADAIEERKGKSPVELVAGSDMFVYGKVELAYRLATDAKEPANGRSVPETSPSSSIPGGARPASGQQTPPQLRPASRPAPAGKGAESPAGPRR